MRFNALTSKLLYSCCTLERCIKMGLFLEWGISFRANCRTGYQFWGNFFLERGANLESRAADTHPNNTQVPPPPGTQPLLWWLQYLVHEAKKKKNIFFFTFCILFVSMWSMLYVTYGENLILFRKDLRISFINDRLRNRKRGCSAHDVS